MDQKKPKSDPFAPATDWVYKPITPERVPTPDETAAWVAHRMRREYRGDRVRCVQCERFFPRSIDTDPTGVVVCPEDRRKTDDFFRENGLG